MFILRQHQQWCGGGGLYWHASSHKSKVQIRKWTIQKSSTSDRYSSTLGECGDSCILMQTWQFNYLCLTWRWKGSESLRAHVHFTVGFFSFKWSYESHKCSLFWQAQHFWNLLIPHMDPQLKSDMIRLCVHNTIRFAEFKWCCFYHSVFKV